MLQQQSASKVMWKM